MTKKELRAQVRRGSGEVDLLPFLTVEPAWAAAGTIGGYVAFGGELSVASALEEARARGVRIALPSVTPEGIVLRLDTARARGWRNIYEPTGPIVPVSDVDLFLVPGVAFDSAGGRLGRGGGHYDRVLRGARAMTIGVAWSTQIVPGVPMEPHDIAVHRVLTELGWIR